MTHARVKDHGQGIPDAEQIERERQCMELRIAGATYEQIAHQVGYYDRSGVKRCIDRALGRINVVAVEDLRKLENVRLDRAQVSIWPLVTGREVEAMLKLHATDRFLRISGRRARLNGLDAPLDVRRHDAEAEQALAAFRNIFFNDAAMAAEIAEMEAEMEAAEVEQLVGNEPHRDAPSAEEDG